MKLQLNGMRVVSNQSSVLAGNRLPDRSCAFPSSLWAVSKWFQRSANC